ncbi:conserved protein [Lachnospiraceae bacterium KM106-2]|nr:conserved protein [Lachnospiraceae bacterium KM106-2]
MAIKKNSLCIGVDGCKGGWIVASLQNGTLTINKRSSVSEIIQGNPDFDEFFIDMVIGLPGDQQQIRPDQAARRLIKERSSTIFPVPCRQAVYAKTTAEAYDENVRVLGKKFTPLTLGIMPKMRELDTFLQENPAYRNVLKESHPEVCFSRLNGKTVVTKKSELEGIKERISILKRYINMPTLSKIQALAKEYRCHVDDIIDAICLAVAAYQVHEGHGEVIPKEPMEDDTGLLMRMVIPK